MFDRYAILQLPQLWKVCTQVFIVTVELDGKMIPLRSPLHPKRHARGLHGPRVMSQCSLGQPLRWLHRIYGTKDTKSFAILACACTSKGTLLKPLHRVCSRSSSCEQRGRAPTFCTCLLMMSICTEVPCITTFCISSSLHRSSDV